MPSFLANLRSHWRFNEASSTDDAVDIHGSYDLLRTGSPATATGKMSGARTLTTSNYFIGDFNEAWYDGVDSFTGSIWFKLNTAPTDHQYLLLWGKHSGVIQVTIGKQPGYSPTYWIDYKTSSGNYTLVAGWGETVSFSTDTWYHLVVVVNRSDNTLKAYVDGVLKETASELAGNGNDDTETPFRVGWSGPQSVSVDELSLWDAPLSASDITSLYNGGAGTPYASYTAAGAAISTYTFNELAARELDGSTVGALTFNTLVGKTVDGATIASRTFNSLLSALL